MGMNLNFAPTDSIETMLSMVYPKRSKQDQYTLWEVDSVSHSPSLVLYDQGKIPMSHF